MLNRQLLRNHMKLVQYHGQGLVEYAMIILLVAVVMVGALGVLAINIDAAISFVANSFP